MNEDPEAQEAVPGALVVRIRENLDFANTAQLKGGSSLPDLRVLQSDDKYIRTSPPIRIIWTR